MSPENDDVARVREEKAALEQKLVRTERALAVSNQTRRYARACACILLVFVGVFWRRRRYMHHGVGVGAGWTSTRGYDGRAVATSRPPRRRQEQTTRVRVRMRTPVEPQPRHHPIPAPLSFTDLSSPALTCSYFAFTCSHHPSPALRFRFQSARVGAVGGAAPKGHVSAERQTHSGRGGTRRRQRSMAGECRAGSAPSCSADGA